MKKLTRFLQVLLDGMSVFGLAVITLGGVGATMAGYLVLSDRYGVLWPSVALVVIYLLCVLLAWAKSKVVKNEASTHAVERDNRQPSNSGSVVKLDEPTVATAIREARERDRLWNRNPVVNDPPNEV